MAKRTSMIFTDQIVERIEYIKAHMGIQTQSGAIAIAVTKYYNELLLQGHEVLRNNNPIVVEESDEIS